MACWSRYCRNKRSWMAIFLQCAAVHTALPLTTLSYRRKYVSASIPPLRPPQPIGLILSSGLSWPAEPEMDEGRLGS